ncbi:MAG: hypothetical protein IK077_09170 [Thermoguttaceae bacterium]|nr:hypothetical protein [Thermoguttaceae bacterium]
MLQKLKTRMLSGFRRDPSSDVKRRFPLAASAWNLILVFGIGALVSLGNAQGAQRVIPPKEQNSAANSARNVEDQARPQAVKNESRVGLSSYSSEAAVRERPVYATEIEELPSVYSQAFGEVRNERCVQKTFVTPVDKDAALVGTFLFRLLPEKLRDQTSWRYSEKNNTVTVYGPEKAIELCEELLNNFSEPLFDAFLASGGSGNIEENAGLATNATNSLKQGATKAAPKKDYYDPDRNEIVKVAYEAEGAVVPDRQEYAVAFGAGDDEQSNAPRRDLQSAATIWGQSEALQQISNNDDSILDVVAYRCLPGKAESVGLLFHQRFADNPSIMYSVDPARGTIIVNTNRKYQREVGAFLASLQTYPDVQRANEPDARVSTGAVSPIDGYNSEIAAPGKIAPQAFAASQSSAVAGLFADRIQGEEPQNLYLPKHRMVEELQDALLQLFGDRLQRRNSNPNDPYSKRQIVTYRFVKRQRPEDSDFHACEVSIDALHNQVTLQGDPVLCSQMLVLLRAMDQPPLRNGNVRKFIPIRNGDSYKLRQIFEYGQQKNARTLPSSQSTRTAYRGGDESLRQTSVVRQVSYQEDEGLGAISDDETYQGARLPAGIGIVQDVNPTVLQDLDVVIIDNATDAEFERIKQMIEQIEELAKIAEIQTEIYNLEHVDCAMLHGVLTTLYAEMFTTKQGRVVFYALQNPNAILVAGWGQAFNDMKDLIELFDKPISEGSSTFRVVRLKYASADEIAALLTETFVTPQTTGTGGLAPRIRAFADVRTNSLIVQAAPNDWNEIQNLLLELDVNKATTKLSQRVFPLKNSLAENMRTTIMNAILPAKQGTLDTSAAKFPVLELLSVDDSGKKLVESGIMMDVDVSADVYHNQLIVTAPEDCMEFMAQLIQLLDVAPKKAQIRFFQVRHGDASQIMKTLQSLLASADDNLTTPTIPQAEGEETFVPVRFGLDTRTNVIIAAAAPRELAIIDALIVALDVKDSGTDDREEVVVQLRNIQALVVAQAIDDYLTQKQTLETASEVLSNYQLYESQVIVIPESISNSIIVSAAPDEMEKILDMIETFDKDPPQVVIQVLIAEVTLSNQEEFGIEAGLQDSVSFDRSVITTNGPNVTGNPGFNITGTPGQNMSTDVSNPKDIAGQVLNNFGMGTSNSSLGYGGFVISANSRSIDVTLRALREKNRLQVLSRPQVTAMDNQQAFILVGQRVPRINGTTTTNYGVQMNTTDTPVGLILLVTPRVTQDGKVVMEIGAEKSSLGNDSDATPIYSQDGEVIKSKSIDTIQAMTAISARDGETVMLGGLLTSAKEKISRGVPYLSDVPILGWLFRYDQEIETRKELLIVMTPRIMRNSADYAETMRKEFIKTTINLDDAMAINGNMGLYDPRTDRGDCDKKTERLIDKVVHMDKMDDLDTLPGYRPENDYDSRPEGGLDSTTPYSRPSRSSGSSSSSSPSSSKKSPARSSNSRIQNEDAPEPRLNEDVLIIDDDYTSNDAPKKAQAERVAMRETETKRAPAKTRASQTREKAETSSAKQEKTSTKSEKQSSSKKKGSDELSDARSSTLETAERYDVADSTIRGQSSARRVVTPVSQMKEDDHFKFLRWYRVK